MGNVPSYSAASGECTLQPLGSEAEWDCCPAGMLIAADLPRNVGMAIAWILLLGWAFLGVALGADAFMTSIETITSQTRLTTVTIKGVKKKFPESFLAQK